MTPAAAFANDEAPAPATATAQDAPAAQDAGDEQEIVVSGFRASLDSAMELKHNSNGVVDAISAEDIGKFPDTNLAESLQRIPGVSINRTNGEGSLVTVRGFGPTYNLVTLNGRQLATSNVAVVGGDENADGAQGTSRSFDFSNLASEGVRTLEVYKTGRAAIPSGGIGATINVATRRPLDGASGFSGSIGAKAVYDTSVNGCLDCGSKVTPEFSGVLNWADDSDTFGVALFGSYQKRNFTSISATSNDWNIIPYSTFLNGGFARRTIPVGQTALVPSICGQPNADPANCTTVTGAPSNQSQLVAIPNDSRYHYAEGTRERINGQAVVQFKPADNITFTADALFAQNKQREERSDLTNWFSRPFDEVHFDANPTVATAVYLHEDLGSSPKDEGMEAQSRAQRGRLQDYGLNLEWGLSDSFTARFDGHYSKAESTPDNANGFSSTLVGMGANIVRSHSVDYTGEIPKQDITLPAGKVFTVNDVGSQVGRSSTSFQDQTVWEGRADFSWDLGGDSKFEFGGNYRTTNMHQTFVQTQQTLGDWGIAHPGDVIQKVPGGLVGFCIECKFSHFNPGNDPDSQLTFRGNAAQIYSVLSPYYATQGNAVGQTNNQDNRVKEKIWSAYGQVTWNGDLGSMKAQMVAGVRYERTTSESISQVVVPSGIRWVSDNDFTVNLSSTSSALDDKGTYDNILPSLDFRLDVAKDLVARLSYSKTIARPNYGDLFTTTTVGGPPRPTNNGGVPNANSGNARLKPLSSDNFDVSLEWYFAPASYVSIGFFDKRVHNFIGRGQVTQSLFGLRDPSSGAAGSRSGFAKTALAGLGLDSSDENLFVMTALIDQTGSVAAATAQVAAHIDPGTSRLNAAYIQQINTAYDVLANGQDPLYQFLVAKPINNKDAEIYGMELAGQYFLGDTGLGVAAAYTLVRGDVDFNIGADPTQDQFALVGLSDTLSGTLIYEKNGISARVAYNWRGKTLSGINRQGSRNPEFTAPFGQLDATLGYDITSNISVTLEGINLTKESVRTYARDTKQLWFAQELDRRFLLGARFKF
jgi:TonB-dependent receptor